MPLLSVYQNQEVLLLAKSAIFTQDQDELTSSSDVRFHQPELHQKVDSFQRL